MAAAPKICVWQPLPPLLVTTTEATTITSITTTLVVSTPSHHHYHCCSSSHQPPKPPPTSSQPPPYTTNTLTNAPTTIATPPSRVRVVSQPAKWVRPVSYAPERGSRCAMGYHRMRVHVDGSGRREDGSGGVGVGEEDVVA
ncbi:hypothetical protein Tco_0869384 [Tanacetum coccineum]